jgi:hypothetical protein
MASSVVSTSLVPRTRASITAQHDLHGEAPFAGVAGVQVLERFDRGAEAALAVFGLVGDGRRQGTGEFVVVFEGGGGGEGGHSRGPQVVSVADFGR